MEKASGFAESLYQNWSNTKHKYTKSVIRIVKGVATKAYVISENKARGIALANVINAAGNTAIMNEHESNDYTELLDDAVESLDYGYDFTVLVTRKPLEASIEANRTNKLRAVVCRSQADASRARKAKANLIIMDDGEFSKTSAASIMRGWIGSAPESIHGEDEEPEKSINITERGRGALGILNSGISMIKGPSRPKARVERENREEEEEVEDIRKPKRGGIIKNIKYVFGIE